LPNTPEGWFDSNAGDFPVRDEREFERELEVPRFVREF
jgi:hypothetical protein